MLIKPKPAEALWLPVSPVRHVAAGTSAAVRGREARVVAEAVAGAERRADQYERAAVKAAVASARAEMQSAHAGELSALRARLQAERRTALQALQAEHHAHLEKSRGELERERTIAREAVEARRTAERHLRDAQEESARLWKQGNGTKELRSEIAALRAKLELAGARRREIVQQREDYRTLVDWYFTDVRAGGDRPFKILSKRLASREVSDRVVAARLMVLCGPSAKPILKRALADRDANVREAVETSLVVLDR